MWAAALTPQKLKCPVVVLVTADRAVPGGVRPVALEIVVVAVPELAADIRKISLEHQMLSAKKKNSKRPKFSPSLCVTHRCNLNCVYCYQQHDINSRMRLETAHQCLDWIFDNVPEGMQDVEIGFIGGEPFLEFPLMRDAIEYTLSRQRPHKFIFYATTNGTLLTPEIKDWCRKHKEIFVLALSLDGAKDTHDHNRSNSFDRIDLDFFRDVYPLQSVKMTLTEYSLPRLAENVKFVHQKGFKYIGGVNLCEGDFDWSKAEYIEILKQQLKELSDFYVEHDDLPLNQMFDRHIDLCESSRREYKKWCGIGDGAIFFDVDGKRYPCPFATPMTFSPEEMSDILKTDFQDPMRFIDKECYDSCYIYPVCPTCAAANYLTEKTFGRRDKRRCELQKLITLFVADTLARRIIKNPRCMPPDKAYYTVQAIKKIRALYLDGARKWG